MESTPVLGRVDRLAPQLGRRLAAGARSAPGGERDLSAGRDAGAGGGRPPGQPPLGARPSPSGGLVKTPRCWPRSAFRDGPHPLPIDAAAPVPPTRRRRLVGAPDQLLRPRRHASAARAAAQGVAIDGKAQRGRLRFAETHGPIVHALSAFCHEQGSCLAHEPIAAGADKAEAELTVAPALLARIDWRGGC